MDPKPARLSAPLLALVLGACVAPVPASRPVPPSAGAPRDPLSQPWVVRPTSQLFAHQLQLDAILLSRVDSAERSDTIRAVVAATWSRSSVTPPTRISGEISEYRVSVGGDRLTVSPADLALPIRVAAEIGARGDQARWSLPATGACGADVAATLTLQEVVFALPESLVAGTVWRDSSEYLVCRDSIPLTVRSSREYRVLGASLRDLAVVVSVERRSTTTMTGRGTQFGEPLTIEAQGTGTMRLELSLAGGGAISGSGDSELALTMRGRRRAQELLQRTRIVITSP